MDGFLNIYDQHKQELFRFILSRVDDADDAEDILSETFIAVLAYVDKEDIHNPRALLYRIARNKIFSTYRARTKTIPFSGWQAERTEEDGISNVHEHVPDTAPLPDAVAQQAQDIEALRRCLARMKERDREILTLKYFDGLEVNEIAEVIERSEEATRVALHRAAEKLQTLFTWHEDGRRYDEHGKNN